ncbi:hypothetical protein ATCC90586_001671 [Pythium insidiosum]|nr:hypothetical protein ATCC90586_001671 [Pythium insidiosum]
MRALPLEARAAIWRACAAAGWTNATIEVNHAYGGAVDPIHEGVDMASSCIRLPLVRSSDVEDLDQGCIQRHRAFMDVVALLASTPAFRWQDNQAFWQDVRPAKASHRSRSRVRNVEFWDRDGVVRSPDDPSFVLSFANEPVTPAKLEWVKRLLLHHHSMASHDTLGTDNADLVRAALGDLYSSGFSGSRRRRLRVDVTLEFKSCYLTSGLAEQIVSLLNDLAAHRGDGVLDSDLPTVEYVVVGLTIDSPAPLSPQVIEALSDLACRHTTHVAIRYLNFGSSFAWMASEQDHGSLETFLRRGLCDPRSKLEALRFESHVTGTRAMIAICSALRYTKTLRYLEIGCTPKVNDTNGSVVWILLLLALQGSLEALALRGMPPFPRDFFTMDDGVRRPVLDAIATSFGLTSNETGGNGDDAASALDALAASFGLMSLDSDSSSATTELVTSVAERAGIRSAPSSSAPSHDMSISSDAITSLGGLQVIARTAEWTGVIVPAGGIGWIHNDHVQQTRVLRPDAAVLPPALRYLVLPTQSLWNRWQLTDFLPFLRMLRGSLHTLIAHGVACSAADWRELSTSLPRLRRLRAQNCSLDDVCSLLPALEIAPTICALHDTEETVRLASFIASPACRLRWLMLDGGVRDEPAAETLRAAIRSNTTIELVACLHEASYHEHDFVRALDRQVIGPATLPLPSRLAFLSVVVGTQGRWRLRGVEPDAMQSIFDLAASCITRRVGKTVSL